MTKNILSIDVEEVFHGEYVRRYNISHMEYRTPKNLPTVLKILEKHGIRATFFIVGEIAKKFPEIFELIKGGGHEIAFHGWTHTPLWRSSEEVFKKEVTDFREICPDCVGFRAPTFSLNNGTKWALNTLRVAGYKFDSSIFPVRLPLYGTFNAQQEPYRPSLNDISKEGNPSFGILEFPLPAHNFIRLKLPIGGGFWLRFWNIDLTRRWIAKMNRNGIPIVIYAHNWELDPKTPRLALGPFKSFITYHNIEETARRIRRLLQEFEFTTFSEYMRTME
jgi:polysaccharide deacetylase family protein (PEP-CTERM system associated)